MSEAQSDVEVQETPEAASTEFTYGFRIFTSPEHGLVALDWALADDVEQLTNDHPTYSRIRRVVLTAEQALDLGSQVTEATATLMAEGTFIPADQITEEDN